MPPLLGAPPGYVEALSPKRGKGPAGEPVAPGTVLIQQRRRKTPSPIEPEPPAVEEEQPAPMQVEEAEVGEKPAEPLEAEASGLSCSA